MWRLTHDFEAITGRPATSIREYVAKHPEMFGSSKPARVIPREVRPQVTDAEQIQVNIRQHALESGCFVVSATAWLGADQQARIMHRMRHREFRKPVE